MAAKKNPKSGAEFTDFSVKLWDTTHKLCEQTYAATRKPPPGPKLDSLIRRAETHVRYYQALLEQYTGGRLEAIQQVGPWIARLIEFTDTLKSLK